MARREVKRRTFELRALQIRDKSARSEPNPLAKALIFGVFDGLLGVGDRNRDEIRRRL